MGSIVRFTVQQTSGNKIKENEMGGSCSKHAIEKKSYEIWSENVKE
jgi:hypothetical protein